MPASLPMEAAEMIGVIHRIDLVNRQLDLLVCARRISVDVPPDCPVLLRGEPVKLRILQPGDYIQVAFHPSAGGAVASQINVPGRQPPLATAN